MNDFAFAIILAVGGGILTAHCSRMTWREVRTGIAKAQYADYRRSTRPVAFWIVIVGNSLAAALGAIFLIIGLLVLIGVAQ